MNASDVAAMSPDERRVRIAEICGWRFIINPVSGIGGYWERGVQGQPGYERGDWGSRELAVGLPNYPEDLNETNEMEKTMNDEQWCDYLNMLYFLTYKPGAKDRDRQAVSATAAQRAEAFLRVMG